VKHFNEKTLPLVAKKVTVFYCSARVDVFISNEPESLSRNLLFSITLFVMIVDLTNTAVAAESYTASKYSDQREVQFNFDKLDIITFLRV